MDDKILSARECRSCTEEVCINASQIYDSCRAKECLENLHVFFSAEAQSVVDSASKVSAENAEVIWVNSEVEPLSFHKGYYTVNLRFFFRVEFNAYTGLRCPVRIDGLATYEKKVVLFGSEGSSKLFRSGLNLDTLDLASWKKANLPSSVVSAVDPIVLDTLMLAPGDPACSASLDIASVPECIHKVFDSPIVPSPESRQIFVTLGLFLMVRLEREVQLTVPAASFCIPDGSYSASEEPGAPCDVFDEIAFPFGEFFPPAKNSSSSGCDRASSES